MPSSSHSIDAQIPIPLQVEDSPKPVRQPRASKKQTQKEGGVSPADPAPAPRKSGGKRSKKSKVNVATQEDTAQPVEEDNEGQCLVELCGIEIMQLTSHIT